MGYIGRPNDSIFDDIKKIADAVAGEESSYDGTKDILRRSLERIADALENGGGGGGSLIVTIMQDADTAIYSIDKTYAELLGAVEDGKVVMGVISYEEDGSDYVEIYPLSGLTHEDYYKADFGGTYVFSAASDDEPMVRELI